MEGREERQSKYLRSCKWRILAASILAMMLDYGFLYALGPLFIPLLEKFMEDRVMIAAIQSTFNGVTFMSSTLTGLFVNKYGFSKGIIVSSILMPTGFFLSFFAESVFHLYATLGVLAGLGNSFAFVSCTMAVGKSFPEHQRSPALSVQMTLMGLTSIIYPYLLDWLSTMYGVNGTFLVMSGLFMNTFLTAIVFRYESIGTKLLEQKKEPDKGNERSLCNIGLNSANDGRDLVDTGKTIDKRHSNEVKHNIGLCSWSFYVFATGTALVVGTTTVFITVAQDIYDEKGLSKSESLSGFLTFNICNTVSRLTPGIFSKLNLGCFSVTLVASVFSLSGHLVVLLCHSYVPIIVGSGLTGAALGGFASSIVSSVFELLGRERQAVGLGIIVTINGIAVTSFGPLFGRIRDISGGYTDVLIVAASLNSVCFMLTLIILISNLVRKRKLEKG